jgi:hypothetical protein
MEAWKHKHGTWKLMKHGNMKHDLMSLWRNMKDGNMETWK